MKQAVMATYAGGVQVRIEPGDEDRISVMDNTNMYGFDLMDANGHRYGHVSRSELLSWVIVDVEPAKIITYQPAPDTRSWFRRLMRPGGD